jgi:hypothetical protein
MWNFFFKAVWMIMPQLLMMVMIWIFVPCRLVGRCRRFGETSLFHSIAS